MDVYRKKNKLVLWIKTPEQDLRIERGFRVFIYSEPQAEGFLRKNKIPYLPLQKQNYLRQWKNVLAIPVPELSQFESFVRMIEHGTRHRIALYNADIAPEQMFLYEQGLRPCSAVRIDGNRLYAVEGDSGIPLKKMEVKVLGGTPIRGIRVNKQLLEGEEEELLRAFTKEFVAQDPDVIVMEYGFSRLPNLVQRLANYGIRCPFHRWDEERIYYKGGRSYYCYGQVRYQDFAIRLHGRFLVDTSTMIGGECDIDAIIELCQLSGNCFQQLASRSFGAVFQASLVRELVRQCILVPFKEKPFGKPITMAEMLKSDRAAHTFDPRLGFHNNVAEIDFCSMFPWIMYNHNISADTILCDKGPFEHVPGIEVRISLRRKGLVPMAIKPILDRRMEYKKRPTALNKLRAVGLKWVLVTSYGYLRFREFKLGIASSHMAVCSYARETLVAAAQLAEEKGFEIVHGIVDSLYIKKHGMTEQEVREFCRELELITGIPVSLEGIFKWIVFLPSINDRDRALPHTYFGAFANNETKTRGIEVRKRGTPLAVKCFQHGVLELMAKCSSEEEIKRNAPLFCKMLNEATKQLLGLKADLLTCSMRITRQSYSTNIPQKQILERLSRKGILALPGQTIKFVFEKGNVVLPEEYHGNLDHARYRKMLFRSLFVLMQPFGFSRENLEMLCSNQTRISDFVKHIYVSMQKRHESHNGLSEKLLAKRLERQGWNIWKGGLIGILRNQEHYPNVERKYRRLYALLHKHHPGTLEHLQYIAAVHHGMPDFLCYRNGQFKFVECKFGHEQLSRVQKRCVARLQEMGFAVEVHKLVRECTKTRAAAVYLPGNQKIILETQSAIKAFLARQQPRNAESGERSQRAQRSSPSIP